MPDYSALAAKHGGTVSAPQSGVDYGALAAKHGGTVSQTSQAQQPTATMSARPDTASNWFEDVGNDIKHGTTITGPGKFLHAIHVQPTRTGEPGGSPANFIGNAMVGATQIGHSITDPSNPITHPLVASPWNKDFHRTKAIQDINELIHGGMNVAAPIVALTAPETLLPTVATYGPIGAGVTKAASALGADPDTAELAGNAAMMATPGVKDILPTAGRFVEKNAPTIGKTAGYGGAAYEVATHPTPTNAVMGLLGAHPLARATEAVTGAIGRGMQHVGNAPILPHEIGGFSAPQGGNNDLVQTTPQAVDAQHFAHSGMGIDLDPNMIPSPSRTLGPGPTEMPAPPEEVPPLIRPAASQIVRGQGGRMTKQYLTGEAQPGTPTQFGAQPPILPGLGESQAPPPLNSGTAVTDTSALAGNGIQPPEIKPLIPIPNPTIQDQEIVPSNPQTGQESVTLPVVKPAPLTNDAKSPTINNEESNVSNPLAEKPKAQEPQPSAESEDHSDILPGDFSLNTPQRFYHGSYASNLINTGLEARSGTEGAHSPENMDEEIAEHNSMDRSKQPEFSVHGMGNPIPGGAKDYHGVFLTRTPEDEFFGQENDHDGVGVHTVDLPRGASMRLDPFYPKDWLIHRGDIPSGRVNTQDDLIDTHGFQQELRDSFDRDQESADELAKKIFYKNNKIDVAKSTQSKYNPTLPEEDGNTDLLPWAQTPWGDNAGAKGLLEPDKVLPGDFSLTQPTRFFHGSTSPNRANTGYRAQHSPGYEDLIDMKRLKGIDPADYGGVFLGRTPESAMVRGPSTNLFNVDLDRGARMRVDPMRPADWLIHRGDVPPSQVSSHDGPQLIQVPEPPKPPVGLLEKPLVLKDRSDAQDRAIDIAMQSFLRDQEAIHGDMSDRLDSGEGFPIQLVDPAKIYTGADTRNYRDQTINDNRRDIQAGKNTSPPVLIKYQDEYHIEDGNHRATAYLREGKMMPAHVIDLDKYEQGQKSGPQPIQIPEPQTPPGPVFTADELKGLQRTQKPGPKLVNKLNLNLANEYKEQFEHADDNSQDLKDFVSVASHFKNLDAIDKAFISTLVQGEQGQASGDEMQGFWDMKSGQANKLEKMETKMNGKPTSVEDLDPNKLQSYQDYRDPNIVKNPSDGPIKILRVGDKDIIVDGNHRVDAAKAAGKSVKANVFDYYKIKGK